jgi:hypothetical protein
MAFDEQQVYGYQTEFQRIKTHVPSLFAVTRNLHYVKPDVSQSRRLQKRLADVTSDKQRKKLVDQAGKNAKQFEDAWSVPSPLTVRGMVVAPNALILAGTTPFNAMQLTEYIQGAYAIDDAAREKADAQLQNAMDLVEGRKGMAMAIVDKATGKEIKRMPLDICPRLDGMIAADGRVYIAGNDGRVVCLGGK